jgi:hypothetical protein
VVIIRHLEKNPSFYFFNDSFSMKNKSALISSLFVLALIGSSAYAQDTNTDNHQITVVIPEVALLDLETTGTKNFSATFTSPATDEAGNKIVAPVANTTMWLNYTNIMTGTAPKKVTVTATSLVDGVDIQIAAGAATTGAGTRGTAAGAAFTLTSGALTLVSDIGSSYTASGPSNGHQITYTFLADDSKYAQLRSGSTPVTVTYTLTNQ